MSRIKKAGVVVGAVLIVITIVVMIIGNKIMNGGKDDSSVIKTEISEVSKDEVESTNSVQTSETTATKVTQVPNTQSSASEDIKIIEINAAELNEGAVIKEVAVVKDKKAYYSEGQVYYAFILKTESNKTLKYYVAYNNYISYEIESQFDVEVQECKDDKGNKAYYVRSIEIKQ